METIGFKQWLKINEDKKKKLNRSQKKRLNKARTGRGLQAGYGPITQNYVLYR